MLGLYVRPDGAGTYEAGFIGSGPIAGTLYPGIGMWEITLDSVLLTAERKVTGLSSFPTIETPEPITAPIVGDITGSGRIDSASFYVGDQEQDWGIWTSRSGGTYDGTPSLGWEAVTGWKEIDEQGDTYGYNIVNLNGTDWSAGRAAGTASGQFLNLDSLGTITGDVLGVYGDSTWEALGIGTWESEPFAYSGMWGEIDEFLGGDFGPTEPTSLFYNNAGSKELAAHDFGLIGLTSLEEENNFHAMGEFEYDEGYTLPQTDERLLWHSMIGATYTGYFEEYEGGFFGFTTGTWKDGTMNGAASALIVSLDQTGESITIGSLFGDVLGNYYPGLIMEGGMWMANGTLSLTSPMVTFNSENLGVYVGFLGGMPEMMEMPPALLSGSFDTGGSINGTGMGMVMSFVDISGENPSLRIYTLGMGNLRGMGGMGNTYFNLDDDTKWSAMVGGMTTGFFLNGPEGFMEDEGYWLATVKGDWSADGEITGDVGEVPGDLDTFGKYLTPYEMGDIHGAFFGVYDQGTWIGHSVGTVEGERLTFSGNLNSVHWVEDSSSFVDNDSIEGLMGGTQDLWGNLNTSQDVTLMGIYNEPYNMSLWALNIEGSSLVTDGVSFLSLLAFTNVDDALTGSAVGLYVAPDGSGGYGGGYLNSSGISGTFYPGIGMWEAEGDLTAEAVKGPTLTEALNWYNVGSATFSGTVNSGPFSGGILVEGYWIDVNDPSWGIFQSWPVAVTWVKVTG